MGNPFGGGKGGSSSPPQSPNYGGAAQDTAKSAMTSQYTPYGAQVYSPDGSSPSGYRSDISLTPQAKGTLDTQMALSGGLANTANQQLPGLQDFYSKPMDLSSVQQISDQAYGAQTSRLDPQWASREESQHQRLANQGLVPGGEAYDNSMREFNNSRNDAYQQARLGAIQTMPQTYQLASSTYNQPLNTFNALRTGAQVQNPTFGQTPSANYLGASQAQGQFDVNRYGIQQGANNNFMQGLFGLGGAAINAWG